MSSTKILIIAAVAILFGFAMGRCDLCFNHSHDRHHDKYADEHHPDETQITSNSQGAIQEIQKQPQQSGENHLASDDNTKRQFMQNTGTMKPQTDQQKSNESLEMQAPSGENAISGESPQQGERPQQQQTEPEATVRQNEVVTSVIKSAMPALKTCYDTALKTAPDLTPNFEMRIFLKAVGGSGKLIGLKSLSPAPLSSEALNCFVTEIARLQFDLSESREGDETSVITALEFQILE